MYFFKEFSKFALFCCVFAVCVSVQAQEVVDTVDSSQIESVLEEIPALPEDDDIIVIEEPVVELNNENIPSLIDVVEEEAVDTGQPELLQVPSTPSPVSRTNRQSPSEMTFFVPTAPEDMNKQAREKVKQQVQEQSDLFFDSEVPSSSSGDSVAPYNMNPSAQPASKYVVVTKNAAAGSAAANVVSAERALSLGRYDSALEMYNALYEQGNNSQKVLMGRALALQNLGREDAALQAYEDVLNADPGNLGAQVNMLGLMGMRYPAVASRRLMQLAQEHPNKAEIFSQLGVLQARVGHHQEALKYLGVASGLQPNNASHLYNMAVIADRALDTKVAVDYYERALEVDAVYGGSRSVPRDQIFDRLAQIR